MAPIPSLAGRAISRRRFVETTLTGSLAGWAMLGAVPPGTSVAAASAGRARSTTRAPSAMPLHAVVFDQRFAEARRFGAAARRRGLQVRSVRGDVTDLWYHELHPLWKRCTVPVAGLTAYAALFCLERLAWDHGMRVVYHGIHGALTDGRVEHVIAAPQRAIVEADWPVDVASLIAAVERRAGWSGQPDARRAGEARYVTRAARAPDAQQALHSWVIALPTRA